MKKRTKFIAVSLSALIAISGVGIAANNFVGGVTKANYKFEINGNALDLPSNLLVFSKDNTTYVPLRFLSESLGAKVGFNQGTITISGLSKDSSDKDTLSDKEKAESALRELELIKKENLSLQKQIKELSSSIEDKNLYRGIPVAAEDGDQFKINLTRAQKTNRNDLVMNISVSNANKRLAFYLKPDKTVLLMDGKSYTADDYSSQLLSTIAPEGGSLGQSNYSGEIYFKDAYGSGGKGSVTFYYSSNNYPDEKSMTIYFDTSK